MELIANDFQSSMTNNHATLVDSSRSNKEVEAMVIMAKRFPRDEQAAVNKILSACRRVKFAETATYRYSKAGNKVEGPSIRLAEEITRCWGNITNGIREVSRENGRSVVEAFAWDIETNTRNSIEFNIEHVRDLSGGRVKQLSSERDVYELIANYGKRRLRTCILALIPDDIIDVAVEQCYETLKKSIGKDPKEKLANLVKAFKDEFGIEGHHIEKRKGMKIGAMGAPELIELYQIYNSIKSEVSDPSTWFDMESTSATHLIEKERLENANAIDPALEKLKRVAIEAKGVIPESIIEEEMSRVDITNIKSVTNGIDRIQSRMG